jgi:hypothetical protein
MRQTRPCLPCPNTACQQPHVVRNGTLSGHQRYHGLACGAWFGEPQGTPRYRLRTPVEEIAQALLLVMRRGSLRAAAEVTGHQYEPIGPGLQLAAQHAEALTAVLVHNRHLSTVAIDACWSFVRRRVTT